MAKWRGVAAVFVVAVLVVWAAWRETEPDRVEEKRRLSDADPKLAAASRELLEHDLPGIRLTMSLPDVLAVHPRLKRREKEDRDGFKVFEEPLGPKRSALYLFGGERSGIGPLMRVQIASAVRGLEAIGARVQDTEKRLGPPSGVWDCPAIPGQLATRRYNYRRGAATALDVYMLVNDEAAATYFVASTRDIANSLKQAKCEETPPSRAHRFPLALPPRTASAPETP
jgi:hypothetical protein